jgi:hypothetical protein
VLRAKIGGTNIEEVCSVLVTQENAWRGSEPHTDGKVITRITYENCVLLVENSKKEFEEVKNLPAKREEKSHPEGPGTELAREPGTRTQGEPETKLARAPAKELTKHSGNWLQRDGTGKLLQRMARMKSKGNVGSAHKYRTLLK